jgi:hypothetical protein
LAVASLPAADHLDDLHPTQLPIAHPHTSVVVEMVMNRGRRWPDCFVVNWPIAI